MKKMRIEISLVLILCVLHKTVSIGRNRQGLNLHRDFLNDCAAGIKPFLSSNMFLSRVLRMVSKKDLPVISRSICATPRSCSNFNDMTTPTHIVEPQIPAWEEKPDEPVDIKRARLLYQSRKRGMLENGLILSTFAAKHLAQMSEETLAEYDRMINLPSNDWDIYYWATGVRPVPAEFDNQVMKLLQEHIKNTNREMRIRQPDLY